jgi:hypothetical protein
MHNGQPQPNPPVPAEYMKQKKKLSELFGELPEEMKNIEIEASIMLLCRSSDMQTMVLKFNIDEEQTIRCLQSIIMEMQHAQQLKALAPDALAKG